MRLRNNLKVIRQQCAKTQEEVATDLGVALATYRTWERGQRSMTGQTILELAGYFGVTTDTILNTKYSENLSGYSFKNKENLLKACRTKLSFLSSDELRATLDLLELYLQLNEPGRGRLLETADDMVASKKYCSH